MADDVGVLYVKVTADTTELINKTQADALAAGKKAGMGFGKKMAAGVAVAGAATAAAAVGITKSIVDLGREYEDNMLKVQAVTGATAEGMAVASETAKALGNDITLPGVSAAGAADAMLQLAKAGFTVEEAAAAADGAMRLAVSAQMDVGQAAEIAANTVGAFGLKAEEATYIADLLARGSTSAATTVQELGTGMAQAAANFAAAGIPVADMVTSMGLMANAGVKGSDAGTSLKTMLQKLTAPTKQSAKAMEDLGVNVFDAQGNLKPMRTLVEDFSKATKDLTEEQRAQAVTTIFGADASRAANIVLMQGVEAYDELAGAMGDVEGAAGDLAGATTKGLSGAIEAIQSQMETVAIEIYEQIAPALTEVFKGVGDLVEVLSPILAEVGATLGNVAGTVLKSLSEAFAALIPAVQPILDIFAKLGEKLGPLLSRVLMKLSEVLVAVFDAVGPLLDVLIDLVFEILDAMWPIVDVLVDALLDMVKAFTPLLRAVTMLLPPFVMLINTVLKILMPILKPLLPVFVAFAEVMGDLMVRAVGALMLAFGKFLSVMGDISPFIRDKVVKPTIAFITAWAAKMVEGAVVAFGWVPGLDKKLEGAAKAVETFGKDAEDAVHQAFVETAADAKAMGDELADVGQDLLDNGAASNAYEAGREIGKGVALGMEAGIKNNSIQAQVAAVNMVKGVEYDSKNYLQQNSPSKRFITIGEGVVEGFVKGLEKGGVSEAMVETLSEGTQAALDTLVDYRNEQARILDDMKQDAREYALEITKALIGNAADPTVAYQQSVMQAENLADAQERLNELRAQQANGRTISDEQMREAENDVAVAQAAAKTFEQNFMENVNLSQGFAEAMNAAAPAIAAQFNMDTEQGRRMYETIMSNIAAAGPEVGTATANAIAAGLLSPEAFQSLVTLDTMAYGVGDAVAMTSRQNGIDQAEALVEGLDKGIKKAKKELKRIGRMAGKGMVDGLRSTIKDWVGAIDDMVKGTKVTLEVRSPSRVFERIGQQSGQGFTNGFAATASANPLPNSTAPKSKAFSVQQDSLAQASTEPPNIRVFIGDQELTDIVDVQIDKNQNELARSLMLGRY